MPDVVKHAWTHRPRAQGGTDPLTIEVPSGIVSHFPRHPVHCSSASDGFTKWPGGVVVVEATEFAVAGSNTTDSTENYTGQSFRRFTTAATTYAAAANLIVIDPAQIELMDDHAYMILFQYRLGSAAVVSVGWEHHGDTPAVVADSLPAEANDWFSLGNMQTTTGIAKVRYGNDINIRAYAASATQIDLDQIIFVPSDYQADSPGIGGDPGTFDTYARTPTGNFSATTSLVFPDNSHYFGQSAEDTQTVNSILDPAFRWSVHTWTNGYQSGAPQPSNEVESFAWEAGHGRHLYASARFVGTADTGALFQAACISYGSNGMPHASSILWNNSWQLCYLGPMSGSHEVGHLAGWIIAADPGGNEAPFDDNGASTVDSVRFATMLQVTCLYDPQGC